MKKIIFVSGIQIFPPESGGQLRSANLCLALVKLGYKVEIYSLTGRKSEYLAFKSSDENKISENLIEYVNRNPLWGAVQYAFYKLGLPPLWLTWLTKIYCPKILKYKLNEASSMVLDFPFLYPLGRLINHQLIVNTHNAEFELYSESPFLKSVVKKIEQAAFKKAKRVLFCNESDFQKFDDVSGDLKSKVAIVPNGIHLDKFRFDPQDRLRIRSSYKIADDETVFLFTGSKYIPNVKAFNQLTEWAQRNADHLVREKIVLLIAGTVSENFVNLPHLIVVGRVPEMLPYFWGADFGLNAITEGSGTNVKMIEYLAAKLPIVTTSFGARGTILVNNKTALFYDEQNLLSVLINAASMNKERRAEMALEALRDNEAIVDMSKAIKNLAIEW